MVRMYIKTIFLLFIFLSIASHNTFAETFYSVSTKEQGITAFVVEAKEIKREKSKSILRVPGFHDRSAAASRWLMCAYTDLAIKRGFKYWIVVYPDMGSEDIIVAFPDSLNDKLVDKFGPEFSSDNTVPEIPASVEKMARFCGMKIK